MFYQRAQSLRTYLANKPGLFTQTTILVWAAILGVAGALTTVLFHESIKFLQTLHSKTSGDVVLIAEKWSTLERLVIPTVGGLVAGLCLYLASRIKVDANSDYMEAVAIGNGRLSLRQGMLRVFSSLSVSASAWSLGREGPIIHLAAMVGSVVGRFFKLAPRHLRLLVACGAAAGVSAAYFAPIAGALLVAEIVLGSMASHILVPLLIASATSFITISSLGYQSWLYEIPAIELVGSRYIWIALIIGLVSGVLAPLFLKYLDTCRQLFASLKLPQVLCLGLGGFLLGCVFVYEPWSAGKGDTLIHSYINDSWGLNAIASILLLKLISTGLSVGAGAVGGVITPVMLVGASVSLLLLQFLSLIFPELTTYAPLVVLVGMGAFLGAATSAPLLAVVLVVEMSHSFSVIAPLILATVLSYFISRKMTGRVMFEVTEQRDKSDEVRVALAKLKVKGLLHPTNTVLGPQHTLQDAVNLFTEQRIRFVYIVNEQNEYQGAIAHTDITRVLLSRQDLGGPIPPDLIERTYLAPLHIGMNLDQAQDAFVNFAGERLPVVDLNHPPRLLGVVYKSDVLRKYSELKQLNDRSVQSAVDIRLS
ncbi:MAG: ClcB-like voltage-gated chloride channel protein [Pelistega sp.]|nr:ClcB-like voltage-gated chloride channel protein [Pelistega sp.]